MPFELVLDTRALKAMAVVAAVAGGLSYTSRHLSRGTVPPPDTDDRPVFADEFDGQRLDTSRWSDAFPDERRSRDNGERQYYAPDGYKVGGGKLTFIAQRRSMGGMAYTSGMVSSFGRFSQRYGRFEIRARFPRGKGLRPAFWLAPADRTWPPQIDVAAARGDDPAAVNFGSHFVQDGKHRWRTVRRAIPDGSADFHRYTLEWKPGRMTWFVDGIEVGDTVENVPDRPMYLIVSLAVDGDAAEVPVAPMEIDYVRVWSP